MPPTRATAYDASLPSSPRILGIDPQGNVGQVQRSGLRMAAPTCGAMAAWRDNPRPGPGHHIDRQDIERELFRERLAREYPAPARPAMEPLAATCRTVIESDFVSVARDLLERPGSLTAVFTGVVLHGHPSGDYIDPGSAILCDPARPARSVAAPHRPGPARPDAARPAQADRRGPREPGNHVRATWQAGRRSPRGSGHPGAAAAGHGSRAIRSAELHQQGSDRRGASEPGHCPLPPAGPDP